MKKGLFAGIVIVVICACAISIMCVTGVFSKKENNKTTTEKTEEKEQLCSKTYNVGDDTYKVIIYKGEDKNKVTILINNEVIDSYEDYIDYNEIEAKGITYKTKSECDEFLLNTTVKSKVITEDENYKYYLVEPFSINKIVLSKNLKTNKYTKLLDFGIRYEFGVLPIDEYKEDGENSCQNRKVVDIVDNYVSELVADKDNINKAYENKYTFANGTYTKTTTEDIYAITCNQIN